MTDTFVYPKLVVLAINGEGQPEFFQVIPAECTQAQVDRGEHYELAKENARFNGFSDPMIAISTNDLAARQIGELPTWLGMAPPVTFLEPALSPLADVVPFSGYAEPHTHQNFTETYDNAWVAAQGEVLVTSGLDFDVDPSQVGLPGQAERLARRIAAAVNVCRRVPTVRLERMAAAKEDLSVINALIDALESLREFAHAALDGGIHQENLDHYENQAEAVITRAKTILG